MITIELQKKLRDRFNPEGSKLRIFQLQMLDILKEIDRICRKHNIPYWLSSGTLLGAVRHSGFIPWDDDIDIEMYKEDYLKFEKVIEKEGFKSSNYVLQTQKTDKFYFMTHAKVCNEALPVEKTIETNPYCKYRGIWVDIFRIEKTTKSIYCVYRFLGKIFTKISWHMPNLFGFGKYISLGCYYVLFKIAMPLTRCISQPFGHDYHYELGSRWTNETINKDIAFPLKEVEFEGTKFYAPNDIDTYLKKQYGDYMKLPDLDKLKKHF